MRLEKDMDNTQIQNQDIKDKSFHVLLESYRLADAQLEMRIQQRDNLGIQLMVAFGVVLSAMTVDNELLRKICIFAMPIITFYFCDQVFSSYDVHARLVFFIKNNIEFELRKYISKDIILWEKFCSFDRTFRKGSRLGGRKEHFMIINAGVPIMSFILYIYFFSTLYEGSKSMVSFSNMLIMIYFIFWEGVAIMVNKRHTGSYEKEMLDLISKCGYLNTTNLNETNLNNKALFIDRDGTIHVDKVETHKIDDLEFFGDVFNLFKTAIELGYKIVIVTNQSGIGKGNYSEKEMQAFNDFMIQKLDEKGVSISALYYCPHKSEDNCQCKKPKDGMFKRAALELNINLSESIMVGDQSLDAYAGLNAGILRNYIVTTGIYKTEDCNYHLPNDLNGKVKVFKNLAEITEQIKKDN